MSNKAVLEGMKVVEVDDALQWAKWFEETSNRQVDETRLKGLRVSTVFLGLNHGHGTRDLWFETMVFEEKMSYLKAPWHNGKKLPYYKSLDDYTRRYETWAEAKSGHWEIVDEVKNNEHT